MQRLRQLRLLLLTSVILTTTTTPLPLAYGQAVSRDDEETVPFALAPVRAPPALHSWFPGFFRNANQVPESNQLQTGEIGSQPQQQQHVRGNLRKVPATNLDFKVHENAQDHDGNTVVAPSSEDSDSKKESLTESYRIGPYHKDKKNDYGDYDDDSSDDDSSDDDSSDDDSSDDDYGYKNKHKKHKHKEKQKKDKKKDVEGSILSKISGKNTGNIFNFVRIDTLSIGARENDTSGAGTADNFNSNANPWLGAGGFGGGAPFLGGPGPGLGVPGATAAAGSQASTASSTAGSATAGLSATPAANIIPVATTPAAAPTPAPVTVIPAPSESPASASVNSSASGSNAGGRASAGAGSTNDNGNVVALNNNAGGGNSTAISTPDPPSSDPKSSNRGGKSEDPSTKSALNDPPPKPPGKTTEPATNGDGAPVSSAPVATQSDEGGNRSDGKTKTPPDPQNGTPDPQNGTKRPSNGSKVAIPVVLRAPPLPPPPSTTPQPPVPINSESSRLTLPSAKAGASNKDASGSK